MSCVRNSLKPGLVLGLLNNTLFYINSMVLGYRTVTCLVRFGQNGKTLHWSVRGLSQITFALGVGRWSEKRVQ